MGGLCSNTSERKVIRTFVFVNRQDSNRPRTSYRFRKKRTRCSSSWCGCKLKPTLNFYLLECELVQDPFNMKIEKTPGGTKDKPQLVPSMYSERIVGCICKYVAGFVIAF